MQFVQLPLMKSPSVGEIQRIARNSEFPGGEHDQRAVAEAARGSRFLAARLEMPPFVRIGHDRLGQPIQKVEVAGVIRSHTFGLMGRVGRAAGPSRQANQAHTIGGRYDVHERTTNGRRQSIRPPEITPRLAIIFVSRVHKHETSHVIRILTREDADGKGIARGTDQDISR